MTPAMVLFDIDGTLVRRAGPHHREALVHAVREVTGMETTTEGVPVHGMLDPDILTEMMRRAGASTALIRRSMPEMIRSAERVYLRTCPDLTRKTCPGTRALLRRLRDRGVLLGLVTGNLTRIGWKKLECAGLREYFRFGAFAEMARDRAGLARMALRRARDEGWIARDTPVALVGDAPQDIQAARANGIKSIAVHTGISTAEELRACAPDVLLEDLRRLRLSMVTGDGNPRDGRRPGAERHRPS
jgi:phosphoglycolate phosphatase-like HAD superfamily hydrolase